MKLDASSGTDTTMQFTAGSNITLTRVSATEMSITSTDTTTNTVIYDASGNALLTVDSTNNLVKAGIGQHTVNTQYAHFGLAAGNIHYNMVANNHYAIPFTAGGYHQNIYSMGTGTNPDLAHTISTQADDVVGTFWYVMDNITIDRVIWWSGADAASGDTTRCHLMSYSIDSGLSLIHI